MEPTFRVGEWLVSSRLNRVEGNGRVVRLEPKVMQVLVCLAERPGEVVSKEELLRRVWADTFVTDEVLTRAISELRRALEDDARQPRVIETVQRGGYRLIAPREASLPAGGRAPRSRKVLLAAGAALLIFAASAGVLWLRKSPAGETRSPHSVAVLPLQNTSGAKELDFLRLGLADDIATTLSYFPSLSLRPLATTSRYAGPEINLQKAAEEMRVADIVTGHFAADHGEVTVTLEAVDAPGNRVLWRETFQGSARDLSSLQQNITAGIHHGLIAALGISPQASGSAQGTRNEEAYELYLRAASNGSSFDRESILLLERAVALDRGYAAAWARLGHYYYYQSGSSATGGESARLNAKAALQRAVALDPEQVQAAADLINMEEEEGELNRAYDETSSLLRRRPNSAAVHLVNAYVLWYPGLLDEAAGECEKARSLDAGTVDLASCGHVFVAQGRYDRARDYFQLEAGTEYERGSQVEILLRQGKQEAALNSLRSLESGAFYFSNGRALLEPCLQHRPPAQIAAGAQPTFVALMADDDSYSKYVLSAWNSLCNQPDLSVRALRRAIEQNYCAYPQMETDPLMENVRKLPEYAELRAAGIACQNRFLEHRKQKDRG